MKRKTAIKFMMSACHKEMDRNTVTRLFDEARKWDGLNGQPEQQARAATKLWELLIRQTKRGRGTDGQHRIAAGA